MIYTFVSYRIRYDYLVVGYPSMTDNVDTTNKFVRVTNMFLKYAFLFIEEKCLLLQLTLLYLLSIPFWVDVLQLLLVFSVTQRKINIIVIVDPPFRKYFKSKHLPFIKQKIATASGRVIAGVLIIGHNRKTQTRH